MKTSEIIRVIKKYGLQPATKRKISLFGLSCIVFGYTKLINRYVGFNKKAFGAIGGKGWFHTLMNEKEISDGIGKFVKNNFENLNRILDMIQKDFEEIRQKTETAEKEINSNPDYFLKKIAEIYPEYFAMIGVYNFFKRYFDFNSGVISSELVNRIAQERNSMAKFYPRVEELLKISSSLIGRRDKFEGELLMYLTLDEFKQYLESKTLSDKKLEELNRRIKEYFYISAEEKENVFVDKEIINKIKNEFFEIGSDFRDFLKGSSAYPGFARGIVYNPETGKMPAVEFILVTSSTHPDDVPVINKCSAIVTDEGGILSHAAIIAREMKKPCIVGTKIATKVLKDGDYVEVDANKGIVRKL